MTRPEAEANTAAPRAALMSMPRCQPVRRRPKVDVMGPSTGHAKAGERSTKSGSARMRPRGPQQPRAARPDTDDSTWLGRRAGGAVAVVGMTSRWPSRITTRSLARRLAATSAVTETPYRPAIPLRVSPRPTRCTRASPPAGAGGGSTAGAAPGVVAISPALHVALDQDLGGDIWCGHARGIAVASLPPTGGRRPAGDDDGRGERI